MTVEIAPESRDGTHSTDGVDRILVDAAALSPGDDEAAWLAHVEWLRALLAWAGEERDGSRWTLLADALRRRPERAEAVGRAIDGIARGGHPLRLLAECGMPQRRSLADAALVRVVRSVIPRVGESRDLGDVLEFVLGAGAAATGFAEQGTGPLADFLEASGARGRGLRGHLAEAVRIHAVRSAAIGFEEDFRRPLGRRPLASSPSHVLAGASAVLLDAVGEGAAGEARVAAARSDLEGAVAAMRADRERVLARLDETGVDMDLVLRLDLLARGLDRIEISLPLLAPRPGERPSAAAAALLLALAADLRHDASLRNLFQDRSHLLARKIVERSGATGARYITVDREAWWGMFRMGAGGGMVIAFAVWMKAALHAHHLPPLPGTLGVFAIYATAFVAIHAAHLTLATKQPPMTAAALAGAMVAYARGQAVAPLIDLTARIARSQFSGLVGNVLATAGFAALFDGAYWMMTGRHILEPEAAAQALASHDPLGSGTIVYAVITGIAVWLSSMVAGWAENAAAYGRLEEGLAAPGPRRRGARGGRLTAWIVRNIGGVAGNVSLAAFLVAIPFLGKVAGAPLDVRHVTMSTGLVTLGWMAGAEATTGEVARALGGVAMIGLLNIATGFALSLVVALRARGGKPRTGKSLRRAVLRAPLGNPLRFFYPVGPKETP